MRALMSGERVLLLTAQREKKSDLSISERRSARSAETRYIHTAAFIFNTHAILRVCIIFPALRSAEKHFLRVCVAC